MENFDYYQAVNNLFIDIINFISKLLNGLLHLNVCYAQVLFCEFILYSCITDIFPWLLNLGVNISTFAGIGNKFMCMNAINFKMHMNYRKYYF